MTATSTSRTRSPITMASELQQELVGVLQQPDDVRGESRAIRAVGDAMIERERERQHQPGDDLSAAHDRLLARPGDSKDGDLGIVDDRNGAGPTERPDVG